MKQLTIAFKDLKRAFRSPFAILFMFVIPLLVTGMFYLMFGNIKEDKAVVMSPTRVVVVNLDQGDQQTGNLGDMLATSLKNESLAELMTVSETDDAGNAQRMVDQQQAGVALIIPADFSHQFVDPDAISEIEFIQDPTLTVGPQIVRSIVKQLINGFAGVKITVKEAVHMMEAGMLPGMDIPSIVEEYTRQTFIGSRQNSLLDLRSIDPAVEENSMVLIIGSIMAGMMVFYAFFTGANVANTIVKESEEGTLQRMLTTATARSSILQGKFLAVGLTVLVQVIVLMGSARLLFGIQWGNFLSIALFVLALTILASGFGLALNAFVKTTKQSGILFGGVLTVTGMLGMVNIFTGNPQGAPLGIAPLFVPQGWGARAILAIMAGDPLGMVLPWLAGMTVLGAVFFGIGVWGFRRRFA